MKSNGIWSGREHLFDFISMLAFHNTYCYLFHVDAAAAIAIAGAALNIRVF